MSEIKSLLSQISMAANEVVAKIQSLDAQIEELSGQRNEIVNAPLSKSDLMEYVREDVKRRAALYPSFLKTKWARQGQHLDFANHERVFKVGSAQPIPYLDGEYAMPGIAFRPDAFYWIFGELIEKRFEAALGSLPWPAAGLPLADRRAAIESLDAQIDALTNERDGLAAELQSVLAE